MATRDQNERKFDDWSDSSDGGRVYWLHVQGHHGWFARYLKKVDPHEITISFRQEVYDSNGKQVEVHEKYPMDRGHQRLE